MDAYSVYVLSGILASLGFLLVLRQRRRKRPVRKFWMRPWLRRRDTVCSNTILTLHNELIDDGDIDEFKATLRMDPSVYNELFAMLKSTLTKKSTNFRQSIPAETRMAMTLRFLALGEGFRTLSQLFRVGLSTSRLIVREPCQAIAAVMQNRYIHTPNTTAEWKEVATEFELKWHFPHCLGAVDGKHIRIVSPKNSGTFYYNYKDFFSIVLMGIVNADYEFIYLDIGAEGKASDGGIWSASTFNQNIIAPGNPLNIPPAEELAELPEKIPYFLVGDDAFKLGPHMMKPFSGAGLSRKQRLFNYRIARARRIVENAFGILACRFKIFRRSIEVEPEFVTEIVLACCILHNFLRQKSTTKYLPTIAIDHEDENGQVIPGAWRQEINIPSMQRNTQKNASEYSKKIRCYLSDYFITPQGEVAWQYNMM